MERLPALLRHDRLPWLLLLLGLPLRLMWPLDFEWKGDERWMFETAVRVARGVEPWPWVGMPSSVGLRNPGFSVWPFAALAFVFDTPLSMSVAVMALNALALPAFALWVWKTWTPEDRSIGLWAVALLAVSPLAVVFSRKIWTQDLLPVFLVPWLWAHARRERPESAFAWGAVGALMAQLHMSGFFAAAALFLATWRVDRGRFRSVPWLLGSACGSIPMVPWLIYLAGGEGPRGDRVASMDFFWAAFKNAWGLDLQYSLGPEITAFMKGPELFGVSTRLVLVAHLALGGLAVWSAVAVWRDRSALAWSPGLRIWFGTLAIGGALMVLACTPIHAHYLVVWTPLLQVAVAWALQRRPRALAATALLQLFLTACFLAYIHGHGGAPRGDYGITYRNQVEGSHGQRMFRAP